MGLATLGEIIVVTPGTLVQVSSTHINANAVYFQALFDNSATGRTYIGLAGFVRTTSVGLLRTLAGTNATVTVPLDSWSPQSGVSVAPFDLFNYWVDADVAADGVLVSYLTV
jgi:hypothetical protein